MKDFGGECIDNLLTPQGIVLGKMHLNRDGRRPNLPIERTNWQGRVQEYRSAGSGAGCGEQLGAGAAIGKSRIYQLAWQLGDSGSAAREHPIEPELLDLADR